MNYFTKWFLIWTIVVLGVLLISFVVLYILKPTNATTTPEIPTTLKNIIKNGFIKTIINSKTGNELFNSVIYTNLNSRSDRRYEIETELQRLGFQQSKIIRNPGVLADFPALGCSIATLNALEIFAKNTQWKNCLFVEDDFISGFGNAMFNTQLAKFEAMHLDWDVLMLCSNTLKYEPTNIDFLVRVLDGQTTAGFAVNRKFLPKLIANVQEGIQKLKKGMNSAYCIDMYWKSLQKNNNFYTFKDPIAYQRDGFSDIQNKMTSYNDKIPLVFEHKKIEYLIVVKTCLTRLNSNPYQLKVLKQLHEQHLIEYFQYYGIENQTEDFLYDQQNKILTVKANDSYLGLCDKVGHLFKFLSDFIQHNENMSELKSCVMTDEDILLIQEHFYEILEVWKDYPYYGNLGKYEKQLNLSTHIIDKCKISKSLRDLVKSKYPLLETVPISVPKTNFTSGGFTVLSKDTVLALAQLDSFFAPFPQPQNLQYHLSKNNEYFKDLAVFDDTQIGIALQSIGILPVGIDISEIAHWD